MSALGFIEISYLSIAAVVADVALKTARISILGFEATGNENILIRLGGGVADVDAALASANEAAQRLRCISYDCSPGRHNERDDSLSKLSEPALWRTRTVSPDGLLRTKFHKDE